MAKKKQTESSIYDIYKSFSDLAMMTLGLIIFLFAIIVMTMQLPQNNEVAKLKEELAKLQEQLQASQADKAQLKKDMDKVVVTDPGKATESILQSAQVGRKDFDLFIEGLKQLPGKDLHLVIDATGSMHGVSGFLIPILRLIVARSGKNIPALTWFSDNHYTTYTGTLGEMFDQLVRGAPFAGNVENIGHALQAAAHNAPVPGAYLLIGDESSDDTIKYTEIPSPVFTLPLGRNDQDTQREYRTLAEKTHGKMLQLDFK